MKKNQNPEFFRDAGIIALSILVAFIFVQTGALTRLLTATHAITFASSFIAGFFFTSIFTTAPAIAALSEITQTQSILSVAFFGALGALCGDFILFKFMRDRLSVHLLEVAQFKSMRKRLKLIFRPRLFRRLTFLLAGLIIASPLPDEIGLSMLGLSKVRTSWFMPLSFGFNFIGIVLVGLATRSFF